MSVFPEFDPVLIQLGPVPIRWYALAYIFGLILGWRYCVGLIRNTKIWGTRPAPITEPQMDDFILWLALGVILGGRLGYVLFYSPQILIEDPLEVFQPWHGGMAFHGGLLGVVLATIFFARTQKLSILQLGDVLAPAAPIGLLLGRIANFINGELWGRVTQNPLGMVFCNGRIKAEYGYCPAGELPRHPSQLYEALLEGLVLFLVLRFATHHKGLLKTPGRTTGLFLLGYGLARASLENVRQPDKGLDNFPLGLTMGMILSVPMMLAGIWLLLRKDAPVTEDSASPQPQA